MVRIRGVIVSLLVVVSACTTSDTAPTTAVQTPPATSAAITTTTAPVRTTTAPAAPTTTVAPDEVGSREVMLEEMRAAWEANQFTYDWAFEDAYIPDLQNPDPLVALEELITFTVWLDANGGNQLWWDVFTVPNSPAAAFWRNVLSRTPGFLYVEEGDGAAFRVEELRFAREREASDIPGEVIRSAPEDSVVLLYSGSDPDGGLILFAPTGEQDDVFEPYSVSQRLIILSPSNSGWAFYWGNWN